MPPGGTWGSGTRAAYATAGSRLDRPLSGAEAPRDLFLRYLAVFGPANVRDFQARSGLTRQKGAIEESRPKPRVFRDEGGNELLDLPT